MEGHDPGPCDCKTYPSAGFRDRIVISLSGETKVVEGIPECNGAMFGMLHCRKNDLSILLSKGQSFLPGRFCFKK